MQVSYGGITLKMAEVEITRRPIYSDTQPGRYLWTEAHVNVSAPFSPTFDEANLVLATAYSPRSVRLSTGPNPDAGLPPAVSSAAGSPASTIQAIKWYFETPQRQLLVTDGSSILLNSPAPGNTVDASGRGPQPGEFHYQTLSAGSDLAYMVNWQCTTWINDAVGVTTQLVPALLHHWWKTSHVVDPDYFLIRKTEGEAIFAADRVQTLQLNISPLTTYLFAPVPFGFQRRNIVADPIPGVAGFRYSYEDYQTTNQFVAGQGIRVARIEATHRQSVVTAGDSLFEGVMQNVERLLNMRWLLNHASAADHQTKPTAPTTPANPNQPPAAPGPHQPTPPP